MPMTFGQFLDAADYGKLDELKKGIAEGIDVSQADSGGWTALLCAARAGQRDVVDLLIAAGVDVSCTRGDGFKPWQAPRRPQPARA